ncbi:MAG: hypothetical protein Q7K43_04570, partial [Candidatus Woesearchaeota archaeon]|nr:hypothetical protein [Candidatus Woesearchaeota archaeon]
EENKNLSLLDRWSIYSDPKQELDICVDCTNQLGKLTNHEVLWLQNRKSHCSLCDKEIKVVVWREVADPLQQTSKNGVFLDIMRGIKYYRICKPCWDRDISL